MKTSSHPIRRTFWGIVMFLFLFCGCKQPTASNPYPYSPDDFSSPVREVLQKIEQHNIAYLQNSGCRGDGSSYDWAEVFNSQLEKIASTKVLIKASKCANPTIRATALSLLMWDSTVNTAELVREHMLDTAQVFDDYGEEKWTVISFMLHNSSYWPNRATRDDIRKELLQKNPFELAAYGLMDIETPMDTFPGYYQIVKKMVRYANSRYSTNLINWFYAIDALEVLANYKREQDIPLIDSCIESSLYEANGHFLPVDVILNFPDTTFEKYYLDTSLRWPFQFRFLRLDQYTKINYDPDAGLRNFLNLVIAHKSPKSAVLLEKIWEYPPQLVRANLYKSAMGNSVENMREQITLGIRKYETPHYKRLLKITEKFFKAKETEYMERLSSYSLNSNETEVLPNKKDEENEKKGVFEAFWWQ